MRWRRARTNRAAYLLIFSIFSSSSCVHVHGGKLDNTPSAGGPFPPAQCQGTCQPSGAPHTTVTLAHVHIFFISLFMQTTPLYPVPTPRAPRPYRPLPPPHLGFTPGWDATTGSDCPRNPHDNHPQHDCPDPPHPGCDRPPTPN